MCDYTLLVADYKAMSDPVSEVAYTAVYVRHFL